MFYRMLIHSSGFILSAYAGQAQIPEGYTAIAEDLYLQIVLGGKLRKWRDRAADFRLRLWWMELTL